MAQSGSEMRSAMMPMTISSLTRPPSAMIFFALRPTGVPALTAARSMSPVESCGSAELARRSAVTAFPCPRPAGQAASGSSPRPAKFRLLDQAFVLLRDEMALDLSDTVSIVTLTTISSEVPPK